MFVAGLTLLLVGGEMIVRAALDLAVRLRVSPLIVGVVIVGFATSLPELMTSVQAGLNGAPGVAIGNVVGSNIANILLILGLSAMIAPIAVDKAGFRRDGLVLALATTLTVVLCLTGTVGRVAGAVLLLAFVAFLFSTLQAARREGTTLAMTSADDGPVARTQSMPATVILGALGLGVMILGAGLLVDSAVVLAQRFGLSDALIGVTIVAVGTSLPELVTSIIAARKGQSDLAFGNVVGSNVFNILAILGITGLVTPIEVPGQILGIDLWVMAGATLALFAVTLTGWRITRGEGAGLMAGYVVYLAALTWTIVGA